MARSKEAQRTAERRQLEQEVHLVKAPAALAKQQEEKLKGGSRCCGGRAGCLRGCWVRGACVGGMHRLLVAFFQRSAAVCQAAMHHGSHGSLSAAAIMTLPSSCCSVYPGGRADGGAGMSPSCLLFCRHFPAGFFLPVCLAQPFLLDLLSLTNMCWHIIYYSASHDAAMCRLMQPQAVKCCRVSQGCASTGGVAHEVQKRGWQTTAGSMQAWEHENGRPRLLWGCTVAQIQVSPITAANHTLCAGFVGQQRACGTGFLVERAAQSSSMASPASSPSSDGASRAPPLRLTAAPPLAAAARCACGVTTSSEGALEAGQGQ
jgi:hypothetical protein